MIVESFSGQYQFLSNFETCIIVVDGETYNSVEHAFQASKTDNLAERRLVRQCKKAAEAKRLGRRLTLRHGWNDLRIDVMRQLLRQKFSDPVFAGALTSTGNATLVHGNPYNERFWGRCRGTGLNWLGVLLMEIRSGMEIRG